MGVCEAFEGFISLAFPEAKTVLITAFQDGQQVQEPGTMDDHDGASELLAGAGGASVALPSRLARLPLPLRREIRACVDRVPVD